MDHSQRTHYNVNKEKKSIEAGSCQNGPGMLCLDQRGNFTQQGKTFFTGKVLDTVIKK